MIRKIIIRGARIHNLKNVDTDIPLNKIVGIAGGSGYEKEASGIMKNIMEEVIIMIYTELTNKALTIAYRAHHGQLDKSGMPYIFHPVHLAEQMKDEISVCVALLHDVLEDTAVTAKELEMLFPHEVMIPVKLLTREKGIDYFEYIKKLRDNPVAMTVKLADLEHNMDQTRFAGCAQVSREQLNKWKNKYSKAKKILYSCTSERG